jgi:hypothetical protein
MNDTTKVERNSYPSKLELEARLLGQPLWDEAKRRIQDWGKRMGAKRVHVVQAQHGVRLETIQISD